MFPSVIDTKNESSKNVANEDYGVYEEHELNFKPNGDVDSPFAVANDISGSPFGSLKKAEFTTDSKKDVKANKEEVKRTKSKIITDKEKNDLLLQPVKINPNSAEKRVSSAGHTPSRSDRKSRIPQNIKKKLRSLSKGGSVMRKYSLENFRGREKEIGSANSIERFRQNLARFKQNTIFKKGSESEKSLRSRESKFSSQQE
jgi:hypothetical protein